MTAVELSEVIRNYAIVVGAAIGLGVAIWRGLAADRQSRAAADQATIDRRAHVTEVFSQAVEQLGHPRLEVRLGAIYALTRIRRDFPDFADTVHQLLTAYAREESSKIGDARPPTDLQVIIDFVKEGVVKHGSGK